MIDTAKSLDLGRPELAALCRRYCVRRLDIFGSAVTEHFDSENSDLDFVASFEPLSPARYADLYFGLRDELAKLFGREVDLVTEQSIANPYFRARIESERQTLFAQ
jgi:predicted nucleotidyltransferase